MASTATATTTMNVFKGVAPKGNYPAMVLCFITIS